MKKLLYSLAALGALLFAAGCAKEQLPQGGSDGDLVEATFQVALANQAATKVDGVSEAANVDALDVFVYDKDGTWLNTLTPTVTRVDQTHYTVTMKLIRNVTYKFVFFAQKSGTYAFSDDKTTITVNYAAGLTNDDTRDAFYAIENDYTVTAAFSKDITLTRPFAQINFGSVASDYAAAVASNVAFDTTLKTKITVMQAPSVLNLLDGTTASPLDVVFQPNKFQGGTLTVSGTTDTPVRYMAMAYVLAPTISTTATTVTLDVAGKQNGNDVNIQHNIANVPFQRNYRTNIFGDVFSVNGQFNVTIDPVYADAYTDPNVSDYTPTYASIAALNTAFAAGSLPFTVTLATPETGIIKLPNSIEDVSIRFMGDFSGNTITIQYADTPTNYPANLTLYAENLGTLSANLPQTHIELVSGSNISTEAVIGSNTNTFVMKPNSYVELLRIIKGSLKVEAATEAGETDAYAKKVVIDASATDANTVIEGKVDDLAVHAGTVEIAETAEIGKQTIAPEVEVEATVMDGAALKAALESGSKEITVTLESDITDGKGIFIKANENKAIVLDLKGHTIEFVGPAVGSTGTQSQALHLEKGNTVTIKNGTIKTTNPAEITMLVQNYCDLTLDGVVLDYVDSGRDYALSNNFGHITITGATQINVAAGKTAFDLWYGMFAVYDDGVYVTFDENFTGTVNGNIEYGAAVRARNTEGWRQKAVLTIKGSGTFNGELIESSTGALDGASIAIYGGTFSDPTALSYGTADSDISVKMVADADLTGQISVKGKGTLDLNGKKLYNTKDIWNDGAAKTWSLVSVQGGSLTITGNGTLAAKENDEYAADVRDGGKLVIENGTFTGNISAV